MSFLNNNSLDAIEIGVLIRADEALLRKTEAQLKTFGKTLDTSATVDPQKINQSNAAITRFAAQARAEAQKNTATFEKFRRTLDSIERQKTLSDMADQLAKAQRQGKDFEGTLAQVEKRLKAIGATRNEVGQVLEAGAQRAAAGGTGSQALAAFGREARLAIPAIGIPGTTIGTETLFRATEILGRLGISTKELAVGGPLAVGALAAITLAVKNFADTVGKIAGQLQAINDARAEAAGLAASGSSEDIVSKYEQAQKELNRLEGERIQRIQDTAQELGNARRDYFSLGNVVAGASEKFRVGPIGAALNAIDQYDQDIQKQQTFLAATHEDYVQAQNDLQAEKSAKEALAIADQHVLTRLQAEIQVRDLSADSLRSQIASLRDNARATEEAIAAGDLSEEAQKRLEQQLRDTNDQLDIFTDALPNAAAMARIKQAQDDQLTAQKTLADLNSRVVDLDRQGRERLAAIVEQGDKQIQAAEERLSDARVKLVDYNIEVEDKRNDINQSYMADDLERLADFRRKEQRITRDADKERIRDLEDHNQNLLDAEAANDVSAFLQEKRNFDKEQRRKQEDQQTALGDRLDDLSQERDKLIQVRDEKLAALDAEATKKRADLAAEIADRDQALIDVKQNIEEQKQAQIKAQDEALRRLVAGLDTSINTIVAEGQTAFAILKAAGVDVAAGIVGELRRQSNPYYSSPYQTSNQNLQASGYSGGANIPLVRLTGFAQGVKVVNQPTLGVFGERPGYNEALIPYRHGESLLNGLSRMGLSGAGGQQFNFDFSGADFGSHNEQRIKDTVITAVAMSMHGLRTGQRPA